MEHHEGINKSKRSTGTWALRQSGWALGGKEKPVGISEILEHHVIKKKDDRQIITPQDRLRDNRKGGKDM